MAIIADSALGRTEQKQAIHAGLVPGGAQTLEGGTALVDPDRIAVDDEEGFAAQNRQSLDDTAAGIEEFLALIGNDDLGRGVSLRPGFDLIGEVMDIDHDRLAACFAKPRETIFDERHALDGHQRLGLAIGQRLHALAEARRHHHGSFSYARHCGRDSRKLCGK